MTDYVKGFNILNRRKKLGRNKEISDFRSRRRWRQTLIRLHPDGEARDQRRGGEVQTQMSGAHLASGPLDFVSHVCRAGAAKIAPTMSVTRRHWSGSPRSSAKLRAHRFFPVGP